MEQLTKPYDITAIPYFPYIPGPLVWIAVLLAALLFLALYHWLNCKPVKNKFQIDPFVWANSELEKLRLDPDQTFENANSKIAIVITRLVEAIEKCSIASLTNAELRAFQKQSSRPTTQNLIKFLLQWNSQKYANVKDAGAHQDSIETALKLIREYEEATKTESNSNPLEETT